VIHPQCGPIRQPDGRVEHEPHPWEEQCGATNQTDGFPWPSRDACPSKRQLSDDRPLVNGQGNRAIYHYMNPFVGHFVVIGRKGASISINTPNFSGKLHGEE
jgi:hypothetical protein